MLTFRDKYKWAKHSQNGEEGLIAEVLKRIGRDMGSCCEFGAPNTTFCCNIGTLVQQGWNYKIFDICRGERVTPENVNEMVGNVNVLSIDVDGEDYDIWSAYTFEPDIVIIEVNSSFAPGVQHTSLEQGTSYTTMLDLGISKNYFLLVHTGNLFFVHNKYKDLFPEITADPVLEADLYFDKSWL